MQGKVKFYRINQNPAKSYGFIIGEDHREYYVRADFIAISNFEALKQGQIVKFNPFQADEGWQARNVIVQTLQEEQVLKQNPDFSVVRFRPNLMLFSEKNRMKVHKNQWLLTIFASRGEPCGTQHALYSNPFAFRTVLATGE